MALGNVYELTLVGLTNNKEMTNVFYYVNQNVAGTTEDLVQAFWGQKYGPIRAILSTGWSGVIIKARNLTGSEADADWDISMDSGARAGERMPNYTTFSFETFVTSVGGRNGRKAFGPIAESDVDGQDPDTIIVTDLNNVATAIGSPVQLSGTDAFVPGTYQTFALGAAVFRPIEGAQFKRVSTQNSRKGW